MFNPKQNLATLIKESLWVISLVSHNVSQRMDTHGREIVQDVASRFIGKYPKGGDGEDTACDERDRRRNVRNAREAIKCRRAEATIYEKGVVVADECEADDTDRLEYAWANESKPFRGVSF